MTKETMTLRSALSQRKMLDKKISHLTNTCTPIGIYYATDGDFIRGTGKTKDAFTESIKEDFQSLSDMIRRREALNVAILNANTENKISLPKFVDFSNIGDSETEEVSFAAAISRKAFYKETLSAITDRFGKTAMATIRNLDNAKEMSRRSIMDQLQKEFAQVQNPSSKQIHDRQTDLESKAAIELIDPLNLSDIVNKAAVKITEYIDTIDIKLGHATEVTEITIEY